MRRITTIALVVAAMGFLWLAGALNKPLVAMRSAYHIDSTEPLENAPPMVVFTTVVLGGFRGLLSDVLWLRAARLQDEGRYIELVQLSDWITKLEPRNAEVCNFHAWNMAYNVSIMMPDEKQRWNWVQRGIELLRDKALRYNPGEPDIYTELAWIFQHKIGSSADRCHMYYRKQLATDMQAAMGGPQPDYQLLATSENLRLNLRRSFGLRPDIMQNVDNLYGPLDWRLPWTHALYWAYCGRTHARDKDLLTCDRMILHALSELFAQGHLTFDPESDVYRTEPYPEILPKIINAYEKALSDHPGDITLARWHSRFMLQLESVTTP